jgi:hypothetical protein
MKTGLMSVDKTSVPYKQFRDGINDNRLKLYNQPVLVSELYDLEYDEILDKVDHPVNSSKDVADAVCGAYNTLLQRRASWASAAEDDEALVNKERADFEDRFDAARY